MSISTEISRIQTATADIKTAITGKGVTVPEGSQIDDLPALITSIPAGSGSSGGGDLDALIQRTITEIHSGATSIGNYAFYGCSALTTADFQLATSIGVSAFRNCYSLTTTDFPLVTSISDYTFYQCSALTIADFPSVTSIDGTAFGYCTTLTTANFPLATSMSNSAFLSCSALTTTNFPLATSIGDYVFQNCSALTIADFPLATSIGNGVFRNCTQLSTLILRENAVCALANMNALDYTPISSGTGYVYVPASLVDAYKAATNWVTYANQIRAIENYPEITGG